MATDGWDEDVYFKKRLELPLAGRRLLLDTAALLFSPHEIDRGSALLLRALEGQIGQPSHILNLTCNYGTLGLALAAQRRRARVLLCDKDLLAVRYAHHNAALNQLDNVEVIESIGVEHVGERFGLIVSHVPSKIGDRAIEHDFLLRPLDLLVPGGSYWLVADSQLNRLLPPLARKHRLRLAEVARSAGQIIYVIHQPNEAKA